jgi:hypothetical protein
MDKSKVYAKIYITKILAIKIYYYYYYYKIRAYFYDMLNKFVISWFTEHSFGIEHDTLKVVIIHKPQY